jgi:signal transduction histidine kinase
VNIKKIFTHDEVTIETNELIRRLHSITEVNHKIAGIIDHKEVLRLVSEKLISLLGVSYAVVWLTDEDNENLLRLAHLNVPSPIEKVIEKFMGKTVSDIAYDTTNIEHQKNFTVKTFLENRLSKTTDLFDAGYPLIDKNSSRILQSLLRIQFVLHVPLAARDKKFGVLGLIWNVDKFTKGDEELVLTFADQISAAIYNSRLFYQVEEQVKVLTLKNRDLSSLYNLTSGISRTLDPAKVAQIAVDSLPLDKSMLGGILLNYDKKENSTHLLAVTNSKFLTKIGQMAGNEQLYSYKSDYNDPALHESPVYTVITKSEPVFSNDLGKFLSPPIPKRIANIIEKVVNIKSIALFPVITRGELTGIAGFFMREKVAEDLEDSEKQLLTTYTNQIAIALENARLYTTTQEIKRNLEKALADLEAARKHERDMIDIMGHELRTPMSIVRNSLVMLDMQLKNDLTQESQRVRRYVDMGLESARREVDLIETLLSATKADGKGFQLILEKVDIVDVINDSITAFQSEATKKGIKIEFEKPETQMHVYADRTRIQEISDNFLSNAVKYTLKGSVNINIRKEGKLVYTSIKDSGIGISEEDMQKLGGKFFRARQYIDDKEEQKTGSVEVIRPGGTGLGLYVTFNLIKILEGKIDIKSEVGVGSTHLCYASLRGTANQAGR